MAVENAKQFLERLTVDSAFRANLQSVAPGSIDAMMDYAMTKGFVFTAPELKAALAEFPDNPAINKIRDQLKIARITRSAKNTP
jgi:predicted ribosomally synthesized peptide with nif11-like leader